MESAVMVDIRLGVLALATALLATAAPALAAGGGPVPCGEAGQKVARTAQGDDEPSSRNKFAKTDAGKADRQRQKGDGSFVVAGCR
jgi:hypothetical protein